MIHNNINYNNTRFALSAPNIYYLPRDQILEILFIGRSNSGKSSTINILTNRKIAKTSKTPGCTKLMNIFEIPFKLRLIDFPGYGYTHVSKQIKTTWKIIFNQYLQNRKNLQGIIFIIDIRHIDNKTDHKVIKKIKHNNIIQPILILLNKSDKISNYQSLTQLQKIKKKLLPIKNTKIIIFSSKTSKGVNELKKTINCWCNNQ